MPGSVIVGGARTPIGKLSGALKGFVDLRGIASTSPLLRIADRRYLRAALPWLRIANASGPRGIASTSLLLRIADRRYLRAALPRLRIANDLTGDQEVATLALAAACTVPSPSTR